MPSVIELGAALWGGATVIGIEKHGVTIPLINAVIA